MIAASGASSGGLFALVVRGFVRITGPQNLSKLELREKSGHENERHRACKRVSPAEWEAARKELLIREKQLTRQRDEVDRQRRELPWVKVEKQYAFEGSNGRETLGDLFEGRSQLTMYLDLTPKGRNETGPWHNLTDWVRHHDRYEAGGTVNHQGRYIAAAAGESGCGCGKEQQ
jgi:hypothetical protein